MILTETHNIKSSNPDFNLIVNFCRCSKQLYNYGNYLLRLNYLQLCNDPMSFSNLEKMIKNGRFNHLYYNMPTTKIAQQTLRKLDNNWRNFFRACKAYNKNPNKFKGRPKPPKYLKSAYGFELLFSSQSFSCKNGELHLGKTFKNFIVKTNLHRDSLQYVKITPINGSLLKLQIAYEIEDVNSICTDNFAAIDLGINNLAMVTFTNRHPLIVNGRPVKSINQYYNKMSSKVKELKLSRKWAHKLSNTRNNKISDYLHKASHYIVNQLVFNNVSILVIGYNPGWKQGTNLGAVNNQKFIQIPFLKFINMLEYKCARKGIKVVRIKESYTSKCSFLDREPIERQLVYKGSRVYRGLYLSEKGVTINADVNGSYNILRKFLNEVGNINIYDIINPIEVCSTPLVYTVRFN